MHRLLLVEVANWKVVSLLGGITLVLAVTAAVRRRHWIVLSALAVLAGSLSGADAVNTYYGYLPQVADVVGVADWHVIPASAVLVTSGSRNPAHAHAPEVPRSGGVLALPVDGLQSGFGRHHVLVYLPPAYFTMPQRRFPVVYLLHGSPGRAEDWLRAGRLSQLANAISSSPQIFVMPPMSRGWLDDSECVDGLREHVETWLVDDVVPRVDATLRTVADRDHRALAGMSAGGYCALNLAIRHSAVFGSALDMSGYTEPTHAGGLARLFGARWRQEGAQNTPMLYLATHAVALPLHLRFDVGRDDARPLREIRGLLPRLAELHIDATLITRPGSHTYHVWVPALRDGMRWLASLMTPLTAEPTAGAERPKNR